MFARRGRRSPTILNVGAFELQAAESICAGAYLGQNGPGALTSETILHHLLQLVNKSLVHFDQDTADLPTGDEAHRRMRESGKLTKVKHPSALHADGRACTELVPERRQLLAPR